MTDKDAPLGSKENPETIDFSELSGKEMDEVMIEMAVLSDKIKTPDFDDVSTQNLPIDNVEKGGSGKGR